MLFRLQNCFILWVPGVGRPGSPRTGTNPRRRYTRPPPPAPPAPSCCSGPPRPVAPAPPGLPGLLSVFSKNSSAVPQNWNNSINILLYLKMLWYQTDWDQEPLDPPFWLKIIQRSKLWWNILSKVNVDSLLFGAVRGHSENKKIICFKKDSKKLTFARRARCCTRTGTQWRNRGLQIAAEEIMR